MQVDVLGPLTVTVGDQEIPIAGPRLRALVIRLALDAPRAVPATRLVDDLWGDDPPADTANALQTLVSRVRRALGAGAISAQGTGYRLDAGPDDVDLRTFTDLVRSAARTPIDDPVATLERLDRALALWRGEPLLDVGDAAWAQPVIRRLHELWLDASVDRLTALLELDRAGPVAAAAQELAADHPLAERLVALQMRALAGDGRPTEALAVYQDLRERLADAFGSDPTADLQALHLRLLRGEAVAPTAAAAATPPDNLPAMLTSFLGREAERARMTVLLDSSRLVTVIGPGGVGKTRLALEVAADRRDRHPDGVWLVSLAPVTDPAALGATFLDALRLRVMPTIERRDTPPRDVVDRLVAALADVTALVVVDNCEHLIDEVADLVAVLTQRCPRITVIATSREPLGLMGEALCQVPPLRLPVDVDDLTELRATTAVRLLTDRARAVNADFVVDGRSAPAVREIIRRLDGLPLAIELAAARLRLLTVVEVAALLSDRFRLLTGGNRAALPRHRTLWAVVDWSWNLLSAGERDVGLRLAAFPGSWDLGAAVAVCADLGLDAMAVQDVLLSLADKSLLDASGSGGYRMLETIREFAVVRSGDGGVLDTARRAHATHTEGLVKFWAPRMRGRRQLEAMNTLQVVHVDIVGAIRFLAESGDLDRARVMALSLVWFWIVTDRGADVIGILELVVEPGPAEDLTVLQLDVFRTMYDIAEALPRAGRDEHTPRVQHLIDRLDDVGPLTGELGLLHLALVFFSSGDRTRATQLADGLLATTRNRWLRGAVQLVHAAFAENVGAMDEVRSRLAGAWAEVGDHPDRWLRAALTGLRGKVRTVEGDIAGAIADLEESYAISVEIGSTDDELQSRLMLAQLYVRVGQGRRAHAIIDEMQHRRATHGRITPAADERWRTAIGVSRLFLAEVEGDEASAEPLRADLHQHLRRDVHRDGHMTAVGWGVLAGSLVRPGEYERAFEALMVGMPIAQATDDHPVIAAVAEPLAYLAAALGHQQDAARMLGAARRLRGAQDAGDPFVLRTTDLVLAAVGPEQWRCWYEEGVALDMTAARTFLDPSTLEPAVLACRTAGSLR